MTKARLMQILGERAQNPKAFHEFGYSYFEEAIPLLEKVCQDPAPVEAKVPAKAQEAPRKESPKLHPERIAPSVSAHKKPPLKRK